ncbi:MAG: sulfotransferase [Cryomorphaceae bacterium]|nr:MAG: sulfotransferase [Cryomorphaceae bacterium]
MRLRFKWNHYLGFFMHPLLGAQPLAWLRTPLSLRAWPTWHFLPKFVFVGLMSVLNLPNILIEQVYRLIRRPAKPAEDPVFIIGHPRSGTTHLQQILSEDPRFYTPKLYEVLFPNYNNTFARLLRGIIAPFLPKTRPQDNVSLSLDSPQEEEFALAATSGLSFINGFYYPKQFRQIVEQAVLFRNEKDKRVWQQSMLRFVRAIQPQCGNRRLILKSPANMARLEAIREIFPHAKFIFIDRNSQRILQSTLHLFAEVLPQTSFQYIDEKTVIDHAFFMYETFHRAYHRQSESFDASQLMQVSHEVFLKQPEEVLASIYRFLGVENRAMDSVVRNYEAYQKNKHKPLDGHLLKRLQAIDAKLLSEFPHSAFPRKVAV